MCMVLCVMVYRAVNFVHSLSGQWLACAMLKHGFGSVFGYGVPSSLSWCDFTLIEGYKDDCPVVSFGFPLGPLMREYCLVWIVCAVSPVGIPPLVM